MMNAREMIALPAGTRAKQFLHSLWALVLLSAACAGVLAQEYPSKPVRVVVPFGPGGTPDLLARAIGDELSKRLGQPFVVDNKPGAGGNIGAGIVARSDADGHQLMMASGSLLTINPSLYPQMAFDFAPISMVAEVPNVLVVSSRQAVKDVRELIEAAKREPGKLFFSSPGMGTSPHLALELFQQAAGVTIQHVPYKSGGEAVTSVLSGETGATFANLLLVIAHIKSGSLRVLAIASSSRFPRLPDVPTMAESGLPGFEASAWFGLVAPAKIPRAIVEQLNSQIARILREPDLQARFAESGVRLVGGSPDEFAESIRKDRVKWARIVKAANIKPE